MENTFIERLRNEEKELQEKMEKLGNFIYTPKFNDLDSTHQALLKIQESAMETYHKCLVTRIEMLDAIVDGNYRQNLEF